MEICVDSLESAKAAILGGAMRLAVCSALSEGGLTPILGLVKQIKKFAEKTKNILICAMIRVRKGNFVYSKEEVEAMMDDIKILKIYVDGYVFGALTPDGHVDLDVCWRIVCVARPLWVTFYSAFDKTNDPLESMGIINDLIFFGRILTSGQNDTSFEKLKMLKCLVKNAPDRIIIMPGVGITLENIFNIKQCGAREFHTSAKKKVYVGLNARRSDKDNFTEVTDEEFVKAMVNIINDEMPSEE